jgi:hypothetical protein
MTISDKEINQADHIIPFSLVGMMKCIGTDSLSAAHALADGQMLP